MLATDIGLYSITSSAQSYLIASMRESSTKPTSARNAELLRRSPIVMGAAELDNPAVAKEAARSHARAAFFMP
jgi:hypothetical protein